MKLSGYQVEFLPLERRLLERRFIDTASSLYKSEKRCYDRRGIEVDVDEDENGHAQDSQQHAKPVLTH